MLRNCLRAFALPAVVGLVATPGCLEFEEQEVAWAYSAEHDRLDVQLVYRGIHARNDGAFVSNGGDRFSNARRQLDQILAGRRLFALQQSFPFCFDLDEAAEEESTLLEQAMGDRIAVDQGDFFRDADGRLCGWQRLRIRGFTEFVAMLDKQLRLTIAPAKEREDFLAAFGLRDAESRARVARALEKAGSFVSHDAGVLVLHLPASKAEARAWVDRYRPTPPPLASNESAAVRVEERAPDRDVRDLEFTMDALRWIGAQAVATPDGIEITFGDPAHPGGPWSSPQRVRPDAKRDLPPDNVAPLLIDRHVTIRTDVTDESLARDFADFRRF